MHALIHPLPDFRNTTHVLWSSSVFDFQQTKVRRMPLSCVWIASWLVCVDSSLLALNGEHAEHFVYTYIYTRSIRKN